MPLKVGADGLRPVAGLLLDAPISATWAANHPELWAERGVSGLLLHTRYSEIPEDDSPILTLQDERRFVEEMRIAVRRLGDSDVHSHFFYVAIAPEADYFNDRERFLYAMRHIQKVARLAKEVGAKGLALDLRSTSLFYDFRWAGYPQPVVERDALRRAAREFGRRLVRNTLQEFPNAEIVLMAEAPESSGPLAFAVLGGCFEGVGAAESVALHLSVPLGPATGMGDLHRRAASISTLGRMLVNRSQDTALRVLEPILWRINPITHNGTQAVLGMQTDRLVPYLAAAKTLGGRYALLQAHEGGWWEISPEEAAQYQYLLQGGLGSVRATRGVHPALRGGNWKTPVDGMRIVSLMENYPEGMASIYMGDENAAVLFWEGTRDRIRIEQRDRLLKSTALDTLEETYLKPRLGRLYIPRTQGSFLVDGMSVRNWAAPASLLLSLDSALQEGQHRLGTTLHLSNPFGITLEGQLAYLAPGYASFGGGSFPVVLRPGESKTYTRLLQGRWMVKDKPDLGASLLFPGGTPIIHREVHKVYPKLAWQQVMDGPCIGAPLHHRWLGGEKSSIIVCGERGDVASLSLAGEVQWERQTPNQLLNGAVAAAGPSAFVFSMDHRGEIWGFDEDGDMAFAEKLPSPPLPHSLHYAASLDFRLGDLVVAALLDGRVWSKPLEGEGWEYHFDGQHCFIVPGLDTANMPYDDFSDRISRQVFVADGRDDGLLTCFDFEDGLFWQRELHAAPTCAPLVVRDRGEKRHRIVTASGYGVVEAWQVETAEAIGDVKTRSGLPILGLAHGDVHSASGEEILAVDNGGIHCFSKDMRLLWHTPITGLRHVVVLPEKRKTQWIAADASGTIYGGDADGKVLWDDDRALAPLSGNPLVTKTENGNVWLCITGSRDGAVRAVVVPE